MGAGGGGAKKIDIFYQEIPNTIVHPTSKYHHTRVPTYVEQAACFAAVCCGAGGGDTHTHTHTHSLVFLF